MSGSKHERRGRTPLRGPNLRGYSVGAWCPTPDGSGPAQAVALSIEVEGIPGELVLRLRSRRAVDEMIALLAEYRDQVWSGGAS